MAGKNITVKIPLETGFLPVAVQLVEATSRAFGMGNKETNALTLATEEVFAFLTAVASTVEALELECVSYGYRVELIFRLRRGMLPLDAFNLTNTGLDHVRREMSGHLGLILAGRIVDRLRVDKLDGDKLALRFVVDKAYAGPTAGATVLAAAEGPFTITDNPELIKEFAALVEQHYSRASVFIRTPGALVDMIAGGEYGLVMMQNARGLLGGGMVFARFGRLADAYGPFVFTANAPELPEQLVEETVARLGRVGENTVGMVIEQPTPEVPSAYFDVLPQGVLFRQLEEDTGARVYVHPAIREWVETVYGGLALPRLVQPVEYMGEGRSAQSAIATELDHLAHRARLRLLWDGENFVENLAAHVRTLQENGFHDIRFRVELEAPEQAMLVGILLEGGFVPWQLLPWGGHRSDLLIVKFQGV